MFSLCTIKQILILLVLFIELCIEVYFNNLTTIVSNDKKIYIIVLMMAVKLWLVILNIYYNIFIMWEYILFYVQNWYR